MNKKIAALIPARYESTRFPGKLMYEIGGKSIIRHVYDNVISTGLFSRVAVVCNHAIIYDEILSHGGEVYLSKGTYENGTDRIAEIAQTIDDDIIFNIQGDEPFISARVLEPLIQLFQDDKVQIVSAKTQLSDPADFMNPNVVKVVTDIHNDALYFSRSMIPYDRAQLDILKVYKHIGVYGFQRETLLAITQLNTTLLEQCEMIECLRYLEYGYKIRLAETETPGVSIDTPEDLTRAIEIFNTK